MDFALFGLLIAQILSCSIYSILAPFLPSEAHKKNVSGALVGLIFSGYPIAASASSLLFAKIVSKIGRKKLLAFGCSCEGFAMIVCSVVPYLSREMFVIVSLVARLCQGLGSG